MGAIPSAIMLAAALPLVVGAGGIVLLDNRARHNVSISLPLVICFVGGLNWTADVQGMSSLSLAGLFRVVCYASLVVWLLLLEFRGDRPLRTLLAGGSGALALWGVWALVSAAWSVVPVWTAYRALEFIAALCGVTVSVVSVRDEDDVRRLVSTVWVLVLLLLSSVVAGLVIAPSQALRHEVGALGVQIQGVLPALGSNGVGDYAAIVFLVSMNRLFAKEGRPQLYWLGLVVSAALLLGSQSRSPLGTLLVAAGVLLALYTRWDLAVAAGLAGAVVALTPAAEALRAFLARGQGALELATFSGRVTIFWRPAFIAISEKLVVGWGAFTGGRYVVTPTLGGSANLLGSSSVDNVYLEVLLGTGFVGLAMILVAVWRTLTSLAVATRLQSSPALVTVAKECFAVALFIVIRGLFATNSIVWVPFLPFMVLVVVADYLRRTPGDTALEVARG